MEYGVVSVCVYVVVSVVVVVCCVSRVSGVCPVLCVVVVPCSVLLCVSRVSGVCRVKCVVVCCRDLSCLYDVGDHGGCVQCVVVVVRTPALCVLFVSFCLCVSV